MTETQPKSRAASLARRLVVAGVIVLVLVAALAWLNRRMLAREALTGWLRSKGVASDAQVEAFGPTTFTASLRIGDPRNPDFTAERAEVRYRARITGLEVVSVTLRKPVLRAQLRQGRLHVGELDPLVQEFLRRPPRPDAAKPRVQIDDGLLLLATDYGPMRLAADALVDDGKLQSLAATSAPARLRGGGFDLALGAAALRSVTRGGRVDISLAAPVTRASVGASTLQGGRLTFAAQIPYPDLEKRRGDGAVSAHAVLTAASAAVGEQALSDARLESRFDGQASGWIRTLVVAGRATTALEAKTGRFGASRVGAVRASLSSNDLRWDRPRGDRVTASLRAAGSAEELSVTGLNAPRLSLRADAALDASPAALELGVTAALAGRGGWMGLGAPAASDAPQVVALKRAARRFDISAPAIDATVTARRRQDGRWTGRVDARLAQPLRLRPDSGGEVRIAWTGAAGRITASGGGLPDVDLRVRRVAWGERPFADVRLQAGLSIGAVQDGVIDASGRLRLDGERLTFTADRCAVIEAERLDFGANDVERLSGRLCPTAAPLFGLRGGAWRLAGRAEAVRAAAPFLQAQVEGGAGTVSASGTRGGMTARADVAAARLTDLAPEARFNPLVLTGAVTLADDIWRADLAVRLPAGPQVATALVTHRGQLERGEAVIDTGRLTFAEGGLQPIDISPVAGAVASPAVGSVQFEGRFDWAAEGASSRGVLTIPRLDFQSPAGPVQGLKGEIAFESLAPLVAAPGQELTIERVEAIVPITGVRARFSLADDILKIEGGEAAVGGGRVVVESLEAPFAASAPVRGTLRFEGVQLHDLVEASPFGDKVEFDAKVSGRVPFEVQGQRVRITGGDLKAIEPGRISIDRTALTGVQAAGALEGPVAPVDPNATFTDFAYQAMENLAFDTLEATIASREDGRLGVLFHIVGRHDPPQKQKIQLSLMDLIQKRFLGRKLPLPSGTGVNLTLDTTLNLDDLLADYAEYQRARRSDPVQP